LSSAWKGFRQPVLLSTCFAAGNEGKKDNLAAMYASLTIALHATVFVGACYFLGMKTDLSDLQTFELVVCAVLFVFTGLCGLRYRMEGQTESDSSPTYNRYVQMFTLINIIGLSQSKPEGVHSNSFVANAFTVGIVGLGFIDIVVEFFLTNPSFKFHGLRLSGGFLLVVGLLARFPTQESPLDYPVVIPSVSNYFGVDKSFGLTTILIALAALAMGTTALFLKDIHGKFAATIPVLEPVLGIVVAGLPLPLLLESRPEDTTVAEVLFVHGGTVLVVVLGVVVLHKCSKSELMKILTVGVHVPFLMSALTVSIVFHLTKDVGAKLPTLHPIALYANVGNIVGSTILGGSKDKENIIGQLVLAALAIGGSLSAFAPENAKTAAAGKIKDRLSNLNVVESKPLMRRSARVMNGRMIV